MENDGPMLLQLKTKPLSFLLTTDQGNFSMPLTTEAAQALALVLLAQPGIGGALPPAFFERYIEEKAASAAKDSQFLKSLGVSDGQAK